jgi:O-acetyl-ADP-ribose deacetylase (regulator of RNase III)
MLAFTTGDILSADVEALVNTVNCVGIMGRGIALQFKNAYPENFKAYRKACSRREVVPGRVFVFATGTITNPKYIINFPTKRHWRGKSRIEDIAAGLTDLVNEVSARNIESVAIPPLGSGLGGLAWPEVRTLIENAFRAVRDVRVFVYEPTPASERAIPRSRAVPKMTSGRAALVGLVERYLGGLLDPFVSLLEIHKLMYFMQEAGEPLRLKYTKGPYGPYAENLRHVLNAVEGHLISGYADGGDAPDKLVELVPGAVEDARAFLADDTESKTRFDRVSRLVAGFESPFGLELLSTVHWVVTRENATTVDDVVSRVYEWSERKKRFSERQIALALDVLRCQGWTGAKA